MAKTPSFEVKWISRLPRKNRRGLAWLVPRPEDNNNARSDFRDLPRSPERRQFRNRFDAWLDWHKKDKWFHGWPDEKEYKDVFQFRYDPYRLMGFLCHPFPDDLSTQICVLVRMVTKHTKHTDTTLKNHMQEYADNLNVTELFETVEEDKDDKDDEEEN